MKMAVVKLALATSAGIFALAACGSANDGYNPAVATNIEMVGGSNQVAPAGSTLEQLLIVKVTNLNGDPVEGVEVEWFAVAGGGAPSPHVSSSDADGLASTSYTLGDIVGAQSAQAVASLSGSPVNFSFTAQSGDGGGGGGGGALRTNR